MRIGLVLAALLVSQGMLVAESQASPTYVRCEISLSAFPPTRTRIHVVGKEGCISQTFEWDPDVPTSLLRAVVWPEGDSCTIGLSADHSFVSAGTGKVDIAWSLGRIDGELRANTSCSSSDSTAFLSIYSGTELGKQVPLQDRPATAELRLNCDNPPLRTSFGMSSAGLGETVAATGRALGAPGGDVVTDIAWAATRAALSRLERRALERVRRDIGAVLDCDPAPSTAFPETCRVIRSLRLSQLESVAAALVRALRDDGAQIALGVAMGKKTGGTGATTDPNVTLVQRLIMLSLADSIDGHAYASALADYATRNATDMVGSATLAADWCLGLLTCNEGILSSSVGQAFWMSGDAAEWVDLTRRIVTLMRALQSGAPGEVGAAARALLTDRAWLNHAMRVAPGDIERVQLLLEVTGPDWLRAVPAMCESRHSRCTQVLGPLVASLGPIADAAAISASTHQEREARREAIATAIERVAELQTDRKERDNDWILSAAVTFDLGYQSADEADGLRFGATLGLALDGPICADDCPLWFHAMLGIVDTTQILTAEVEAAREPPPAAADDGMMAPTDDEMTDAMKDDTEFSDDAEWETLFYPSLRAGLGIYSREFPILVTAGVGVGRVDDGERVRARPMFLLGVSVGVPLIDLN